MMPFGGGEVTVLSGTYIRYFCFALLTALVFSFRLDNQWVSRDANPLTEIWINADPAGVEPKQVRSFQMGGITMSRVLFGSRRRTLRVEQLENRLLLNVGPAGGG